MEIKNVRFYGFVEVQGVWASFDKVIPTMNENPFEDIQEALRQLDIEHYLVTYEEIKNG